MSAETLRRAAALMRERAEASPEGPWLSDTAGYRAPEWPEEVHYRRVVRGEPNEVSGWRECVVSTGGAVDGTKGARAMRGIAEHIASWHPAVALAVADWLDLMAEGYAPYWSEPYAAPFVPVIEKAYQIARAYLGESA